MHAVGSEERGACRKPQTLRPTDRSGSNEKQILYKIEKRTSFRFRAELYRRPFLFGMENILLHAFRRDRFVDFLHQSLQYGAGA